LFAGQRCGHQRRAELPVHRAVNEATLSLDRHRAIAALAAGQVAPEDSCSSRTPVGEHSMPTIHLNETTTATPEQFLAGLTDFGPDRSKIWGNSTDDCLKVHDEGATQADVTEGSRSIWETLHYDWSDPRHITLTTTDSNVWGGHSGHTYSLTTQPDGTTEVDAVIVREGKNLKGRLLGIVVGAGGKRVLGKALGNTVKAIEVRNYRTEAGDP
jgi:hypothetical protein